VEPHLLLYVSHFSRVLKHPHPFRLVELYLVLFRVMVVVQKRIVLVFLTTCWRLIPLNFYGLVVSSKFADKRLVYFLNFYLFAQFDSS
jgi:hypothetical protein